MRLPFDRSVLHTKPRRTHERSWIRMPLLPHPGKVHPQFVITNPEDSHGGGFCTEGRAAARAQARKVDGTAWHAGISELEGDRSRCRVGAAWLIELAGEMTLCRERLG